MKKAAPKKEEDFLFLLIFSWFSSRSPLSSFLGSA